MPDGDLTLAENGERAWHHIPSVLFLHASSCLRVCVCLHLWKFCPAVEQFADSPSRENPPFCVERADQTFPFTKENTNHKAQTEITVRMDAARDNMLKYQHDNEKPADT